MPVTATGNHEAGLQVRPRASAPVAPAGSHEAGLRPRVRIPGRLLRLASDDRLVEQLRAGSEPAFEAIFDRHHRGMLAFCRHMLGSAEEAEDAVQHTFLAAYSALTRTGRPIRLRPWLYTIARNRCLSVLRSSHRAAATEPDGLATEHLAAVVERRQDLRDLLGDLSRLPDDQRAALVLAELGGFSHEDIADVVGCRREKVKALVFQARSSMIAGRAARETPCEEIREQLASLAGGALRRAALRRHLRECAGCREFRDQVHAQRRELALVLPVAPSLGLKSLVMGTTGSAAGAGLGSGVGAASGSLVAKVVVAVAVAGGGTVAVEKARERPSRPASPPAGAVAKPAAQPARDAGAVAHPAARHDRRAPAARAAGHPATPSAVRPATSKPRGLVAPDKVNKRAHQRTAATLDKPRGHHHAPSAKPAELAKRVTPAGLAKPASPIKPAKPARPAPPGQLAKLKKPAKPATPNKPAKPLVSRGHSRGGGSAKPEAPPGLARRAAPEKALRKVQAAKPAKPAPKVRVERTKPEKPAAEPVPAAELPDEAVAKGK